MEQGPQLQRRLGLLQATAINMIDMVGIGPFVTLSIIVGALNGPYCMLAWVLGALLAYMDGTVWAELGAKWPEAGGSYVFLQKLFGEKYGRMMAFLFVWQTSIQAPLVMASAAIGFSEYFGYLVPTPAIIEHLKNLIGHDFTGGQVDVLTRIIPKVISGTVVLLMMAALYRRIGSIGNISIVLSVITAGTILWIIVSGLLPIHHVGQFTWQASTVAKPIGFAALALASQKAIYSYLGYYNVCHLGAEIKDPERNIPRAIFISITGIAILYLAMQAVVIKVLPWQVVAESKFPISLYFNHLYNHTVAQVATALILCIALSSLFSVMLGYSRIPYAAALDGNFFKVFARLHPTLHIPHISLVVMGLLAFVFSLLFRLGEVISAIIAMRILIQFVSQAAGVIMWHVKKPDEPRPYKMWLFPVPAIISIIIWLFIFCNLEIKYILFALGIIVAGLVLYAIKEQAAKKNERPTRAI